LPTGQFKELGGEHVVGGGHAGTVGTAPDELTVKREWRPWLHRNDRLEWRWPS
jgi:hypothetical protein